jgi:hypothetical protein
MTAMTMRGAAATEERRSLIDPAMYSAVEEVALIAPRDLHELAMDVAGYARGTMPEFSKGYARLIIAMRKDLGSDPR